MRNFAADYNRATRNWLEFRFSQRSEGGLPITHEPIYGIGKGPTEGEHLRRAVRLYDLIRELRRLQPKSVLDVGAAEGYFAALVKEALGIPTVALDASAEAGWIASSLLEVPSIAANASALPFPDNAFEVVTLAEVVEHLSDPVGAFLEAQRVASRFVLISTEEWASTLTERKHILSERHLDAHMERNVFCSEDLTSLFGQSNVVFHSQRFLNEGLDPLEAESSLEEFARFLDSTTHYCEGGVIMVAATNSKETPITGTPDFDQRVIEILWRGLVDAENPEQNQNPLHPDNLACPQCHVAIEPRSLGCANCQAKFERGVSQQEGVANLYFYRSAGDNLSALATPLGIPADRQQLLRELDDEFAMPAPQFDSLSTKSIPSDWGLVDIEASGEGWLKSKNSDPQIVSTLLCLELSKGMECSVTIEFQAEAGERLVELFILDDSAFNFEQRFSEHHTVSLKPNSRHEIKFSLPDRLHQPGHYLMRLRLDPTCLENDAFRIHEIAISSSPERSVKKVRPGQDDEHS